MKLTTNQKITQCLAVVQLLVLTFIVIIYMPTSPIRYVIIAIGIMVTTAIIISVKTNEKQIYHELIKLSRVLESHINGNPIQLFSEIEDQLLSKIQYQLTTLDELYSSRYCYEKQEKNRLNSLISDISHQLKTPLSNLMLYQELLERKDLSKEDQERFKHQIKIQLEKLEWLMDALVKVSRIETGIIQIHKKDVSVSELILQAIDMVMLKAEKKNMEIIFEADGDRTIMADKKWMVEAIFNLIDNAVKYSQPDSQVVVKLTRMELFSRIDIEDSADKIDPKEVNEIFKRFYRVERTTGQEGVGIGLFMSRDIVTRHDGYITVESGKVGNRFSVFLS